MRLFARVGLSVLLLMCAVAVESRSDAVAAVPPRACSGNETFQCEDGRCIPAAWRCDGDIDCKNEEDEKNCPTTCSANEHKCGDPKSPASRRFKCIPQRWVCDGEFDCEDKSDEKGCKEVVCDENQFKCEELNGDFNLCIPKTWVCDGQRDCANGQDEEKCEKKHCAETDFACSNGNCIYKSWQCDGEDDCGDGSDEVIGHPSMCNVSVTLCDKKDMWKCSSGDCIPARWRCDGEADCLDHSDERNCTSIFHTCKINEEFACKSSLRCINKLWYCDGEEDCPDGSDEMDCAGARTSCLAGEKQCPSTYGAYGADSGHVVCIPESSWCNGVEDCPDGGDEKGCKVEKVDCREGLEFKCPSTPTQCFSYDDLCVDSKRDCGEGALSVCANKSIIQMCKLGTPGCKCHKSYIKDNTVCSCGEGWKLEGGQCVDVDECMQAGSCDQICKNTPGSYTCACHAGYKLSYDTSKQRQVPSRCRAMGGDPLVLLSNRAMIRQFDLVTNVHFPLLHSPGSAVAMDFHLTNGTLVWSDITTKKIMMCKIGNETGPHHILTSQKCDEKNYVVLEDQINTPDGLAIDWIHDLLFWTDGGLDQVNVLNLQTGKRRVLFSSDLEEPRAIAVDPEVGLIFWTDWGQEARIERSGMDGQHRVVIVKGDRVKWPNGLALDYVDKRVYWADAKIKSIFSCDYWGKNIKTVLHSHDYLRHPFSLAVFEDRVYYTDWDHDGVITVNKFTGDDVRKVMDKVTSPMTVRIYHKQAQPFMENKCIESSCEHLCLPRAVYREADQGQEKVWHDRPFSCACEGKTPEDIFECLVDLQAEGGLSLLAILLMVSLVAAIVGGLVFYRRRTSPGSFMPIHFDNPIYRRTTEANEQQMDSDPFRDPFADNRGSGINAAQLPRLVISDEDPESDLRNNAPNGLNI